MAAYHRLYESGELHSRVQQALTILECCHLCPRGCGVNRLKDEVGECHIGRYAMVSSYGPHFGEEAPLVGQRGSGTIFFTYCNLRCLFCQNYQISQSGEGEVVSAEKIADMMLSLQGMGCHNINLVSPTHVVPQILEALEIAVSQGLSLPLVYNTGGYDSVKTLKLLDGIVDIYMPDMKYSAANIALRLSGIRSYPAVNRAAVKEMHRQVGELEMDGHGVAIKGLLVRHLVLPHGLAGTAEVVRFLAQEVSTDTYLNVMAQYHPCHKASQFPELSRPITGEEFTEAVELAESYGLHRLDHRERRLIRFI
jgi:putative pyruvate formate lyase activating enzyme